MSKGTAAVLEQIHPADWGITRDALKWWEEDSRFNNDLHYGRLDLAARGLFDSLRRAAWTHGPLPFDTGKLAFLIRADECELDSALPRVIGDGLFVCSEDGLTIAYPPQEAKALIAMKKIAKKVKDGQEARARQLAKGKASAPEDDSDIPF